MSRHAGDLADLQRLHRQHWEDGGYFHDGWMDCTCQTAERIRELFDRLNPRPPKPHRLAVLD